MMEGFAELRFDRRGLTRNIEVVSNLKERGTLRGLKARQVNARQFKVGGGSLHAIDIGKLPPHHQIFR